ncbi:MAG: SDR family NAD(P)-dependent oxidoreductase [Methylocella sp.]
MQGKMGTKGGASYSASKWGILGLMKSAALELGQYTITVNVLIPGLIGTLLTYNEQRFRAAIIQSNRPPTANPTAQELGTPVRPQCPFRSAGCSQRMFRRWRYFWRQMPPPWRLAGNLR